MIYKILRFLLPFVVLAASLVVAVGIVQSKPDPERKPRKDPGALVEVEEAQLVERRIDLRAQGTVIPAQRVVMQPQVSGRIARVARGLAPGAQFAAGSVLFEIESADYELAVERQKAALAEARAQLELERGRQRVAEREWQLFRDEVDASERQASLALREPQLRAAEASVATAEARLAQAELDLSRTQVKAPFSAMVLAESVEPGQTVSMQSQAVTLVGTDVFWVQASIPTDQLSAIDIPSTPGERGSPASVSVGGSRYARSGRVERLLGGVDPAGRMARVLVAIDDPLALEATAEERRDLEPLLLDSYVDVTIQGARSMPVFELHRDLLREGDTVWVFADGLLEVRDIEIAWRYEDSVLVSGGLLPGEEVVTSRLATPIAGMSLRRIGAPDASSRELTNLGEDAVSPPPASEAALEPPTPVPAAGGSVPP